ncbi:MAG TPA: bifunctional tetrahydrofolate synthase/dihydrofolate synthase [Burkholderiaceae bacterium]|nr:bifunctional tetrahydrofolate synthase/dihydrofolate synthase [Burkholderiaceae bacterium]
MQSLSEWLEYLEAIHPHEMEFGLDRVTTVKNRLGIEFECPVFIVGGTNGKGSTCAFLESILLQAGYKVGLHTSPHLVRFNERARLNGQSVDDDALLEHFEAVEAARRADGIPVSLSYFEFSLLVILRLFQHARLDAVILEVGLGGRLDAVNCIDADCSIITSIDLDHTEYLGDTREKIGWEKAHIFRTGRPAICSDPQPPQTVIDYAREINADLRLFGRDFNYAAQKGPNNWQQWGFRGHTLRLSGLAYPALRGANQLLNASAALAALDALRDRLPITHQAVRNGFALVDLPGRFQTLPGRPTIVLDVAHNPHAAAALADNLDHMGFHPYTWAVFGCMKDKDIAGVVRHMKDRIDHWIVTDLPTPRAARAVDIERVLREAGVQDDADHSVLTRENAASAFNYAREHAGENDRIVVFGSFVTVGGVMQALARQPR